MFNVAEYTRASRAVVSTYCKVVCLPKTQSCTMCLGRTDASHAAAAAAATAPSTAVAMALPRRPYMTFRRGRATVAEIVAITMAATLTETKGAITQTPFSVDTSWPMYADRARSP